MHTTFVTVCKQWFPVVTDTNLATDMLLGCDVLGQAPLIWQGKKRVLMWGNTPYVVNHIPKQKARVSRVKIAPVVSKDYLSALISLLPLFHDAWHPSSFLSSNRDGCETTWMV